VSEQPGFSPTKPARIAYWATIGALLVLLFLIGIYDEPILQLLTSFWQQALAAVGLQRQAQALQQGINGGILKRFLPAVATYAVLYLSICLLLLHLLLPAPAQWRLAVRLYAGALTVYVAMVLLNKLTGNAAWAYRLSRHLLDFIVSPLPVAALVVLFKSGLDAAVETSAQRTP
jgi:hypothetical protein